MSNSNREELKNRALTERIGALTARYEDEMAGIRVDVTILVDSLNKKIEELNNEVANLRKELEGQTDNSDSSD